MCPYKYIAMFGIRSKFAYFLFMGGVFVLISCTSDNEKNRPSPPASDSTQIGDTRLSINYSSPGVKKRKIWGELVPYGEIWRTGANKATYLTTSDDILINDKKLNAGKYAMFTITTDSIWTIIFNEEWDQWGAYNYDPKYDVLKLAITPKKSDYTERMTFTFVDEGLKFEWENLYYILQIKPL